MSHRSATTDAAAAGRLSKRAEAITDEAIVSADSHVSEPEDLWARCLPRRFKDRELPLGPTATSRKKPPTRGFAGTVGGRDPSRRCDEMDADGVSAEVLYPTLGLRLFGLIDSELQEACFEVYNDWLIDYCGAAPPRLIGLCCISAYDVGNAVREMQRCQRDGLRGAVIWQAPPPELPFTSEHYEPIWAAAEELEMPVNLHIESGFDAPMRPEFRPGVDRTRRSTVERTFDAVNALYDFIFAGILDRHPRLKLVIAENEIGWIPFMLQQWDSYCHRHAGLLDAPITELPSDYFRRQVSATFIDDGVGARLIDPTFAGNCMWSSDFPHRFSPWPNSRDTIERDLGHLGEADRHQVICGNAARLYHVADLSSAPAH